MFIRSQNHLLFPKHWLLKNVKKTLPRPGLCNWSLGQQTRILTKVITDKDASYVFIFLMQGPCQKHVYINKLKVFTKASASVSQLHICGCQSYTHMALGLNVIGAIPGGEPRHF